MTGTKSTRTTAQDLPDADLDDVAGGHVAKVDSFTWEQTVIDDEAQTAASSGNIVIKGKKILQN